MSTGSSNAEETAHPPEAEPAHDPYAAMRIPNFRRYWFGNLFAMLGMQMQSVAIGWEIYNRTGSNHALAMVGLIQFLPVLFLALPAGTLADRFNRKTIVLIALATFVVGSLGLAAISFSRGYLWLMYACLLVNGTARAVHQPAKASLMPNIVPREAFTNAVTWNGSGFQLASVLGPALAGLLIAQFKEAYIVYVIEGCASFVFFVLLSTVTVRHRERSEDEAGTGGVWQTLSAGLSFLWRTKIILGAISLDLFAVLLGGATTLLPVFAKDILRHDPESVQWLHAVPGVGDWLATNLLDDAWVLGCLRAAPAVGALLMALLIAHRPPMERAGRALLWSVAGFGVATIVFGLSRSFWLSLTMLLLTGALDMISVVIRHTLVQLLTPDEMRGRVQAVNGMFIGASNELGGFESGEVAHLFSRENDPAWGPTVSVVAGGIGTLLVVAGVGLLWPPLRRYGRLDGPGERH